ncbi:MAG: hypothetical protein ACRDNS_01400, partial [Trebonia sp.]
MTDLAFSAGQGAAFLAHWKRQQAGSPAAPAVTQTARNWRDIAQQVRQQRADIGPRTREEAHG